MTFRIATLFTAVALLVVCVVFGTVFWLLGSFSSAWSLMVGLSAPQGNWIGPQYVLSGVGYLVPPALVGLIISATVSKLVAERLDTRSSAATAIGEDLARRSTKT